MDSPPAADPPCPGRAALPCDPVRPKMEAEAIYAFLVALAAAAVLTPLVARVARRAGAVDEVKDRGLAREATPLLGGIAIFAGTVIAAIAFMPESERTRGILTGAAVIVYRGGDRRRARPAARASS